jgi:NhaA family Na+:H+ antiporter
VLSGGVIGDAVSSPVTQGIFAGLVLGKLAGILLASFIAVRLGLGELPAGSSWMQVTGAATLAGIGFTVSLFITELAFSDRGVIDDARIGIFAASIVAGIAGYLVLRMAKPAPREAQQETEQAALAAH